MAKGLRPPALSPLPTDILKQLEQDEAAGLQEFHRKAAEKREKALEAILAPLRAERDKLDETIKDALTRTGEIDREISKLTGRAIKPHGRTSGGTRGKRLSTEGIREYVENVVKLVGKAGKDGLSRKELLGHLAPLRPSQLGSIMKVVVDEKPKRVEMRGTKSTARYHAV